jgi:hypothetical protein
MGQEHIFFRFETRGQGELFKFTHSQSAHLHICTINKYMVQQVIIFLVFMLAAFYVARLVYKSFSSKSGGCAKGCGTCSTIDFDKIRKQLDSTPRS